MCVEVVRIRGDYLLIVADRISDLLNSLYWSVSPYDSIALQCSAFDFWPQ